MVNNGNVLLVGRKIAANNREESDFTQRSLSRIMDETTLESKDTAVGGGKARQRPVARTMMAVEMGAREIRVGKEEWGL